MKKTLLLVIATALFAAGANAGTLPDSLIRPHGIDQTLTFDDLGLGGGDATSGTYMQTDTFSFDVILTYAGYNSSGLSFWLETNNAFAGSLSIVGLNYGTAFPDATQFTPNPAPFNATMGATSGFMTEQRDLGATCTPGAPSGCPQPPGTYFVAHITFSIQGAAMGTYVLQSTVNIPHGSEATSDDGMGEF